MSTPELSIIVPTLNEMDSLPALLASLACQTGVCFELIVVDGGSTDGTLELLQTSVPFDLQRVRSPGGRARQLNAGAGRAVANLLLFLHADSVFPATDALAAALRSRPEGSEGGFAGRFRLRFRRQNDPYGFGYYFWECKARLDRDLCVHGDQGLLVTRELFQDFGPFDEQTPIAPETWFADQVRHRVPWQLLPAVIETSARRFESEGLGSRQTLNALLMNFAAIGWNRFFERAGNIYRHQNQTALLKLNPYLDLVDELLGAMPTADRRRIWLATGRFVRSQAWQIPFALDARRGFARKLPPENLPTPLLRWHDRWFDRLTGHRIGELLAALLTWVWFRMFTWRARRRNL